MALGPFLDATGESLTLAAPPCRIVSLIPSVTELLFALGAGAAVAGCTVYCTEPPDGVATKTRVGGEKNPKLEMIRDLGADLVIANVEENLREHVRALRSWGIPVYVIYPHAVAEGIRLVRDLGEVIGRPDEGRAMEATLLAALDDVRRRLAGRAAPRIFYPIWRRPWMTIGRDTYAHDMLTVCNIAFIDWFFPERSYARCTSPAGRAMRSLFCETAAPPSLLTIGSGVLRTGKLLPIFR